MKTILCLHALLPQSRGTTFQHIYSFPRYGPGNLYVIHHLKAPVTEALKRIPFDGIILNYCFLGHRTERVIGRFKELYAFVGKSQATKIAICQDDYTNNETLDAWLDEMGVGIVYSPITRDLEALYPRMFRKPGVEFREGLTGYVDDGMLPEINELALPIADRPIDIGSRVRAIGPYLGKQAQKKAIVSERFCLAAAEAGFVTDFSTDPNRVFLGTDWLRFLGSCRATIGSRGGASMPDAVGSIKAKCLAYLEEFPTASYDEVKAACFPGMKDTYRFDAISPRLFEAAATRTCQILTRDDYLGLNPYEDYIPLEDDFSNLPGIFELLRNSDAVARIINNAHRKLIASGRFSYESFVREVLDSIPLRAKASAETHELVEQHLRDLEPFLTLDEKLGSLTAQAAKRAIEHQLRNKRFDRQSSAWPSPGSSAVAALIKPTSFPNYPDRAIRFQMLSNWASEHEIDLGEVLNSYPYAPDQEKSLQTWDFCECIFDAA